MHWGIKLLLFLLSIIVLSIVLDRVSLVDRNLKDGDCVKIIIGNSDPIQGQVYNLRADGRYTIHYLTDRGQHFVVTLKRFQFTVVDCINNINAEE